MIISVGSAESGRQTALVLEAQSFPFLLLSHQDRHSSWSCNVGEVGDLNLHHSENQREFCVCFRQSSLEKQNQYDEYLGLF